ncbi:C-type natriuretic peptide 2-like, partial [Scleropages formosus]
GCGKDFPGERASGRCTCDCHAVNMPVRGWLRQSSEDLRECSSWAQRPPFFPRVRSINHLSCVLHAGGDNGGRVGDEERGVIRWLSLRASPRKLPPARLINPSTGPRCLGSRSPLTSHSRSARKTMWREVSMEAERCETRRNMEQQKAIYTKGDRRSRKPKFGDGDGQRRDVSRGGASAWGFPPPPKDVRFVSPDVPVLIPSPAPLPATTLCVHSSAAQSSAAQVRPSGEHLAPSSKFTTCRLADTHFTTLCPGAHVHVLRRDTQIHQRKGSRGCWASGSDARLPRLLVLPLRAVPEELLGAPIGSLLLGRPEVGEGSADSPAVQSRGRLQHRPRLFLDFLGPQRKFGSRTRSSRRGCFGLKMDRIGAVSGLGCKPGPQDPSHSERGECSRRLACSTGNTFTQTYGESCSLLESLRNVLASCQRDGGSEPLPATSEHDHGKKR